MSSHLTPGQTEILRAYLAPFSPSAEYNPDTDRLLSTEIILADLGDAAEFDLNPVADFLVAQGYRYHCLHADGISGWILHVAASVILQE